MFPNITGADETDGLNGDIKGMAIAQKVPLLPEGSPEQVIAMSSETVFERMLASKCPTWSQKKGCVAALEQIKKIVEDLDAKLLSGTPLTDSEQDMYDAVSIASLEEKESYVKAQMHSQVENGNLTKQELDMLLNQVSEKIATLDKEISQSQDKPKKVEKLKAMKQKAEDRQAMLEKVEAKAPPRLRHEAQIQKLRVELQPLQQLEDSAKGRLLSVKETQTLARKEEILEEIAELEVRKTSYCRLNRCCSVCKLILELLLLSVGKESSRGWYEDDEAFEVRVNASRAAFAAKAKQKTSKKPTSTGVGYKSVSASKWVMPGAQQKKGAGAWGTTATKKKTAARGGSVFAAMMMDSDSD